MAKKEKKAKTEEVVEKEPEAPKVDLAALIRTAKSVKPGNYCVRNLAGDVVGRGFQKKQEAKVFRNAQPKSKNGALEFFVSRDSGHLYGEAQNLPTPPDSAKKYNKKTVSAEEVQNVS